MSIKVKIIIASVALLTAFASGRYLAPTKVVTEIKTVEVEKKTAEDKTNTNKHKETTTTTITKPDGTKETTTKVVEDTNKKTDDKSADNTTTKTDNKTETDRATDKVTISALAGFKLNDVTAGPTYGLSVSKPILGPIAIGIWGLTNTTAGASIGLSF